MDTHPFLSDYLTTLARRLPEQVVEELADGLDETWRRHLAAGLGPTAAADAAVAEFGTAEQIVDAFVAQAPGRRTARIMLVTGPLVGVCWGTSLVAAKAWTWPVPTPAMVLFALVFACALAALIAAASSRHSYRRTHLGAAGGVGLAALDTSMIATALLIAPVLVWPMALAIPASLVRIAATMRALKPSLTGR